jgi:hypothetical protein
MSRKLHAFNENAGDKSLPAIKIGIGINTGPLVLGTMGANDRMQCSVLGDTVNLASRIEQLTRVYDAQCLVGEQTYDLLKDSPSFSMRMIDRVAVKGKGIAVKLYEVLDAEVDDRRTAKEATKALLEEALDTYYGRDFSRAHRLFTQAMQEDPLDPVFPMFAARAKHFMESPPPGDWQGFEKLDRK